MWIARIMITWGIITVFVGFVHTSRQFYIVRFLLGAAEAGFFPGVIVYLTHWFTRRDLAKAVASFMAALPLANLLGSPLAGRILQVHWYGLEGWRWLFILEGFPALIFGVMTFFYLTDRPSQAAPGFRKTSANGSAVNWNVNGRKRSKYGLTRSGKHFASEM